MWKSSTRTFTLLKFTNIFRKSLISPSISNRFSFSKVVSGGMHNDKYKQIFMFRRAKILFQNCPFVSIGIKNLLKFPIFMIKISNTGSNSHQLLFSDCIVRISVHVHYIGWVIRVYCQWHTFDQNILEIDASCGTGAQPSTFGEN